MNIIEITTNNGILAINPKYICLLTHPGNKNTFTIYFISNVSRDIWFKSNKQAIDNYNYIITSMYYNDRSPSNVPFEVANSHSIKWEQPTIIYTDKGDYVPGGGDVSFSSER